MSVVIETTIGDITVDLFLKERPRTCLNFLKLCKVKYYNFCLFHKIQQNFIAQSGDPSATGRSGESVFAQLYGDQAKYFDLERKPQLKHKTIGTLSMVNNGNNMNGSQFFITLGEDLTYLDDVHTVFGEVTEGLDILLKLNDTICDDNHRPYQDIRITHTVILHDPYEDPNGLNVPPSSPLPTKEVLASDYVGADEDIDDNQGRSVEEIEEEIKEKEAKARATILEMVGDIPDVDVKPPETVLFVCKLNPVTTAEDLEVIFSRFGTILSCEVIKDKKTGESLQYAFIEFEKEEDCENAYFKMDNVLIDDRRIHVDFSQSVAKLKWERENKGQSKKSRQEQFRIKDKTTRGKDYDMVFDPEENKEQQAKHSKHKKQKASGHRSNSRERYHSSSKGKHHGSREQHRHSKERHRSRSKERHSSQRKEKHSRDKDHYSRSKEKRHSKERSHSRERHSRDKHHSKKRH